MPTWEMYCSHSNENPAICECVRGNLNCGCREGMCKSRGKDGSWGSSGRWVDALANEEPAADTEERKTGSVTKWHTQKSKDGLGARRVEVPADIPQWMLDELDRTKGELESELEKRAYKRGEQVGYIRGLEVGRDECDRLFEVARNAAPGVTPADATIACSVGIQALLDQAKKEQG